MVELRKRKAPAPAPAPVARPAKKRAAEAKPTKSSTKPTAASAKKVSVPKKVEKAVAAVAAVVKPKAAPAEETKAPADTAKSAPSVGDVIDLSAFGGEVETQDAKKVTLKQLVDKSKSGVVLFTYPKASTPGCTIQACAFRDGHTNLTSTGIDIYGLSGDSPKANTTFKTRQSLPYDLLCDPAFTLINAIGMQNGTAHKTKRGVFAVDKSGKVLLAQFGGPLPTVEAVKKLVEAKV
jgi:peroxiredoxin Q/BCP